LYPAAHILSGGFLVIIAQLSDIHAHEHNDNLTRLDRALAWLDLMSPDALVLTGDLIDDDSVLDGHYSSLMPSLKIIEPFTIPIRLV
jgi:predicted MPP superfamily phosphohydrolase